MRAHWDGWKNSHNFSTPQSSNSGALLLPGGARAAHRRGRVYSHNTDAPPGTATRDCPGTATLLHECGLVARRRPGNRRFCGLVTPQSQLLRPNQQISLHHAQQTNPRTTSPHTPRKPKSTQARRTAKQQRTTHEKAGAAQPPRPFTCQPNLQFRPES